VSVSATENGTEDETSEIAIDDTTTIMIESWATETCGIGIFETVIQETATRETVTLEIYVTRAIHTTAKGTETTEIQEIQEIEIYEILEIFGTEIQETCATQEILETVAI